MVQCVASDPISPSAARHGAIMVPTKLIVMGISDNFFLFSSFTVILLMFLLEVIVSWFSRDHQLMLLTPLFLFLSRRFRIGSSTLPRFGVALRISYNKS
jgi:hypothetical protein